MFISPHLETVRERISIGNEWISEEDFMTVFERVQQAAKAEKERGYSFPSFSEFLFLMAMCFFGQKNPDYIILETGMGGRLDATNCIAEPKLCVITEIGYDHMQYLGDTIEKIAAEKAGIIKPGIPVVFVDKRPESTVVLAEYAKKAKSPVIILKKDDILDVNINNKTIDFSLHTGYYNYVSLFLDTPALYQTENAALAAVAAQALMDGRITPEAVRKGLGAARWPGRMEEVLPGVYLDGAHNEDAVKRLRESLEIYFPNKHFIYIMGVFRDKEYEKIAEIMAPLAKSVHTVNLPDTDRTLPAAKLAKVMERHCPKGIPIQAEETVEIGVKKALINARKEDVILAFGSLSYLGQVMTSFKRIST